VVKYFMSFDAIRAELLPDRRPRLRSEIHKRVASIDFNFNSMTLGGTDHGKKSPLADIRFVNGALLMARIHAR
jgi:hypothetical protein